LTLNKMYLEAAAVALRQVAAAVAPAGSLVEKTSSNRQSRVAVNWPRCADARDNLPPLRGARANRAIGSPLDTDE
jgi:hypothetical protein